MAWIQYPYHVKHAGREYAPGVPIEVDDAQPYIARGAITAEAPEAAPKKPRRCKKAQGNEAHPD